MNRNKNEYAVQGTKGKKTKKITFIDRFYFKSNDQQLSIAKIRFKIEPNWDSKHSSLWFAELNCNKFEEFI